MRCAALLGAVLALGACKKGRPAEPAEQAGSAAPQGSGSAAAPAPTPKVIDAPPSSATVPFALPAGARTVPESKARKVDATALGPSVTVQLANQLGEEDDGYRHVDESLVLVGSQPLVVELAYDSDDAAAHAGSATGALYAEPPLSPPRPFRTEDATIAKNPPTVSRTATVPAPRQGRRARRRSRRRHDRRLAVDGAARRSRRGHRARLVRAGEDHAGSRRRRRGEVASSLTSGRRDSLPRGPDERAERARRESAWAENKASADDEMEYAPVSGTPHMRSAASFAREFRPMILITTAVPVFAVHEAVKPARVSDVGGV